LTIKAERTQTDDSDDGEQDELGQGDDQEQPAS